MRVGWRFARPATASTLATLGLIVATLACAGVAQAQGAAAAPPSDAPQVAGHWVGARLRCQKDEGKLVRCGTPESFEITFSADGSGVTPDEGLPKSFSWRWLPGGEIGIAPAAGGEELKLFGLETDGDELTFQAYVFLPTADPNAPPEVRYIHYVFDVSRDP